MQDSLIKILKALFRRDLNKLKEEISDYTLEANLWLVKNDIRNSGGNLCLHLVGNLRHFVGTNLGNTDYIRQREHEFSLKDVPKAELLKMIDQTLQDVEHTLDQLTTEELKSIYPQKVFGREVSTEFFLVHLAGHLNWHLGQINYHRRLLDV